jgi:hypothetical protein
MSFFSNHHVEAKISNSKGDLTFDNIIYILSVYDDEEMGQLFIALTEVLKR